MRSNFTLFLFVTEHLLALKKMLTTCAHQHFLLETWPKLVLEPFSMNYFPTVHIRTYPHQGVSTTNNVNDGLCQRLTLGDPLVEILPLSTGPSKSLDSFLVSDQSFLPNPPLKMTPICLGFDARTKTIRVLVLLLSS